MSSKGYKEYSLYGYNAIEFDSTLTHAEYIKDTKGDNSYEVSDVLNNKREREFYGDKTMLDVADDMVYGDMKATATLLDNIKEPKDEGDSNTGVRMDIEGVAYDMGSVISGEPECCVAMDAPTTKKAITILIDLGYSGRASAKSINYRSVGIVNLISTLQAQGYILNVQCGRFADCRGGKKYAQIVNVNTDTLCIAQIASVTSVGYYRGACWLTTAMQMGSKSYNGQSGSRLESTVIDKLAKDGVFYINGGFTLSKMESLKSPQEGIDIVVDLFNKFCGIKEKVGA